MPIHFFFCECELDLRASFCTGCGKICIDATPNLGLYRVKLLREIFSFLESMPINFHHIFITYLENDLSLSSMVLCLKVSLVRAAPSSLVAPAQKQNNRNNH